MNCAMDAEFHSLGLVLGYEYTDSPVIAYDDGEQTTGYDLLFHLTARGAHRTRQWCGPRG